MPAHVLDDPAYRRLRYLRYADDFLLGFAGPRREAEEIKRQLGEFLRDELKLELSEAKTLITHGRTQSARFLGYEVTVLHDDHKHDRHGHRSINGKIGLKVPADVVRAKCRPYMRNGKAIHRPERINDSEYEIVVRFQVEFRGLVEYYQLAFNLYQLARVKWMMQDRTVSDGSVVIHRNIHTFINTSHRVDQWPLPRRPRCSNGIGSLWWCAQAATRRSMPDGPSAGHGNETPESRMTGNGHVRFGGRPPQKYRPGNRRQLGGGPPNYLRPRSRRFSAGFSTRGP